MGGAAFERAATRDEVAAMVAIVEAALKPAPRGEQQPGSAPTWRARRAHSLVSSPIEPRADTLAAAVHRKTAGCCRSTRDQARGNQRRGPGPLGALADVSGAVVSWNDFGMGTPKGDERSNSWRRSRERQEIYAVARCQRAETRFTLEEALRPSSPARRPGSTSPGWTRRRSSRPSPIRSGVTSWPGSGRRAKFMANASVEKAASTRDQALEGRLLADVAEERGAGRQR